MKAKFLVLAFLLVKEIRSQNLLQNPGFENPLNTGWTILTGNWDQFNNGFGYGTPHSGTYYTSQGFGPAGELFQTIDVSSYATEIDNNTKQFSTTGYLQVASNGDSAIIVVDYKNGSGTTLAADTISETVSNFNVWSFKQVVRTAPPGTRSIKFRLRTFGFDLAMFDDVSLTATTVLPLTLLDFSGTPKNDRIILNWKTANEINTKCFWIEKSNDGLQFSPTAKIDADAASLTEHNYSYAEQVVYNKPQFYRLKIVDNNGTFTYSSIIKVYGEKIVPVSIYPNPVNNFTTLTLPGVTGKECKVALCNVSGQVLKKWSLPVNHSIQLNLQDVKNGMYFITVQAGDILAKQNIIVLH
jgi:hypothetical protein